MTQRKSSLPIRLSSHRTIFDGGEFADSLNSAYPEVTMTLDRNEQNGFSVMVEAGDIRFKREFESSKDANSMFDHYDRPQMLGGLLVAKITGNELPHLMQNYQDVSNRLERVANQAGLNGSMALRTESVLLLLNLVDSLLERSGMAVQGDQNTEGDRAE